jgi:hypothetical protein
LDEIDLQHLRDTNPCQSCSGREEMYDYLQNSIIKQEPIDYLEFGVAGGGTLRYWVGLNENEMSRFFGFDSFQGLPEDWQPGKPKGYFNVGGSVPHIADGRVQFIKGWFEDTIPHFVCDFQPRNRMVLHIDADLYGATMLALVHISMFMSKGTLIIFDELYDRDHEFKALTDWQKIYRKDYKIIANVGNYAKVCVELG